VFSIDAKHFQFAISFLLLDLLILTRSTSFLFQEKNSREYFLRMTSMLLALLTAPALLATNEAIRQGQTKDRREEHRARRSNLIINCVAPSSRSLEIDHRQVALKDNKVLPSPTPPGY
jgi:hypothetical protein